MSTWYPLKYNKELYATHIYVNDILTIKGLITKETTKLDILITFTSKGKSKSIALIFKKQCDINSQKVAEIDIKNERIIVDNEYIKISNKNVMKELKELRKYAKQMRYMDIFGGRCMSCNRKTEDDIFFCRACLDAKKASTNNLTDKLEKNYEKHKDST